MQRGHFSFSVISRLRNEDILSKNTVNFASLTYKVSVNLQKCQ